MPSYTIYKYNVVAKSKISLSETFQRNKSEYDNLSFEENLVC